MKRLFRSLLLALPFSAFAVAPPNDNLANATEIGLDDLPFENIDATREVGELNHAHFGGTPSSTIWLKYRADFNGVLQLDTAGSTQADTIAAAYTGTSYSTLRQVARGDDFNAAKQAKLVFPVTSGTTYLIALDSRGETGLFRVRTKALIRYRAIRYESEILPPNDLQPTAAENGKASVTFTKTGFFTGTMTLGTKRYPLKGKLSTAGNAYILIPRVGLSDVIFVMQPALTPSGEMKPNLDFICNTHGQNGGDFVGEMFAVVPYSAANPCPRQGRFTYNYNTLALGLGFGFAGVNVDALGNCRGVGTLGDGTPFSFAAPILNNAHIDDIGIIGLAGVTYFHSILSGGGQITSSINVQSPSISGMGRWFSAPGAKRKAVQVNGYELEMFAGGLFYSAPAPGQRMAPVFDGPNGVGKIKMSAPLAAVQEENITLSTANKVTVQSDVFAKSLKITVDPKTGFLKGSYIDKASGAPFALKGIYINRNVAPKFYGIVTNSAGCGPMTMEP